MTGLFWCESLAAGCIYDWTLSAPTLRYQERTTLVVYRAALVRSFCMFSSYLIGLEGVT